MRHRSEAAGTGSMLHDKMGSQSLLPHLLSAPFVVHYYYYIEGYIHSIVVLYYYLLTEKPHAYRTLANVEHQGSSIGRVEGQLTRRADGSIGGTGRLLLGSGGGSGSLIIITWSYHQRHQKGSIEITRPKPLPKQGNAMIYKRPIHSMLSYLPGQERMASRRPAFAFCQSPSNSYSLPSPPS